MSQLVPSKSHRVIKNRVILLENSERVGDDRKNWPKVDTFNKSRSTRGVDTIMQNLLLPKIQIIHFVGVIRRTRIRRRRESLRKRCAPKDSKCGKYAQKSPASNFGCTNKNIETRLINPYSAPRTTPSTQGVELVAEDLSAHLSHFESLPSRETIPLWCQLGWRSQLHS